MQSKEQRREKQTEYRERMQLKVAREIEAGKRNNQGRKIQPKADDSFLFPADYTGSGLLNWERVYFINGQRTTKEAYVAHVDGE
jgi:hypothetical protein